MAGCRYASRERCGTWQRKPVEYRGGGNAVESGKHPAITQDTDIVERRLNNREHIANCGFGLVHQRHLSNVFHRGRGAGEGTTPAQGVVVTLSLCGKGHRVARGQGARLMQRLASRRSATCENQVLSLRRSSVFGRHGDYYRRTPRFMSLSAIAAVLT